MNEWWLHIYTLTQTHTRIYDNNATRNDENDEEFSGEENLLYEKFNNIQQQ